MAFDEATKKSVARIPLLKTNAGPKDGELWAQRLREEYQSLIEYVKNNKEADNDWFRLESSKDGVKWFGKCWHIQDLIKYEFAIEFEIPVAYPTTAPEIAIPELDGKTAKMYRGGKICLTDHFKPLWSRNVPKFGIGHALALGLGPWLAVEIPDLISKGLVLPKENNANPAGASENDDDFEDDDEVDPFAVSRSFKIPKQAKSSELLEELPLDSDSKQITVNNEQLEQSYVEKKSAIRKNMGSAPVMAGRQRSVAPSSSCGDPDPSFDSLVSLDYAATMQQVNQQQQPSSQLISQALQSSQIYVYEYDPDTLEVIERPRHILPFAVVKVELNQKHPLFVASPTKAKKRAIAEPAPVVISKTEKPKDPPALSPPNKKRSEIAIPQQPPPRLVMPTQLLIPLGSKKQAPTTGQNKN